MFELDSLNLEFVHSYHSAGAEMNSNAVTFIRGLNFDADQASPTSNGSGKSLFFSTIPNLLLSAPPLALKKKSVKDLIAKKSKITMGFKTQGKSYLITQAASGSTIVEDGVDLQVRTKPLQDKFIQDLFPLREIEFYTYGYIASQRSFNMQQDSDSDRLEHLTSMFRLDNYAVMRKHFATKLSEIKGNEVKLSVLEQSAISLRKKLKSAQSSFDEGKLLEVRDKYTALESTIAKLSKDEFERIGFKQTLSTLLKVELELDALRKLYTDKRPPKEYLGWAKCQRDLVKERDEYDSVLSAYRNTVKKLRSKLDTIEVPSSTKDELLQAQTSLKDSMDTVKLTLSDLSEAEDKFNEYSVSGRKLIKELDALGVDPKSHVPTDIDYDQEISECKTSLRLEKLLHTHLKDADTCPTCLSPVDKDNIKSVVLRAKKKLPTLEKIKTIHEKYTEVKELSVLVKELNFNPNVVAVEEKKLSRLTLELKSVQSKLESLDEYLRVKKTLDGVEKPKPPKDSPSTELSYDELGTQIDLCNDILRSLSSKSRLLENHPEVSKCRTASSVRAALRECESDIESLSSDMSVKRTLLGKHSAFIEQQAVAQSEVALYSTELESVTSKINVIKPTLADRDVLETLIRAYGTKGLKTVVANEICGLLENNLNQYRDLILLEPFTFSVRASDTGLSILVDRGAGRISDVRLLSGAESNCFRLLFVIALLPLIPDARRLNFIVLDEPTGHCDDVTRALFCDTYLAALSEIIPNVFVITNNVNEHYANAKEWLVTKRGGISTLVTEPSAIAKLTIR